MAAAAVLAQQPDAGSSQNAERRETEQTPSQPLIFQNAQTSLIQNTFIAAPMSGVVSSVDVTEGQMIVRDATLVQLDGDLAKKEVVASQAALDAASLKSDNDVNLRYAKRTYQVREHELRQSQLANRRYEGAVSSMEMEEIRLQVDQAALAIEQAEHDLMVAAAESVEKEAALSIANTKLDHHTVRTRVAGMVTEIDVEPGEWVEAGKPMVRVISLDPLRVECFVDGREHGRELVGRGVQFVPKGWQSSQALEGRISFVSPEQHPVTGQVRLWATIANPGGKLGSGTPGSLTVQAP